MLTDIFARRYENRLLFERVGPREHALLVQAYRIIDEQIFPYYLHNKKVNEESKSTWTSLHDRLTMELGLKELSPKFYSYQTQWNGNPYTQSGFYDMNLVCEVWLTKQFQTDWDPDTHIKRRLSFVELAFRDREHQIEKLNNGLEERVRSASIQDALRGKQTGRMIVPGTSLSNVERVTQESHRINNKFSEHVRELNERFRQAEMPLHYHNGFIQITTDSLTQTQIQEPFWDVVKDPKWANVSLDMATATDLRDTGGRDPVFFAGKALESTIKIISDDKQWTTGREKGASDYLNHLESKSHGCFITGWERKIIQAFFSGVRNDFGHGAGSAPMPIMTEQQTDQSIEFCMSWIKSLIRRI